jgi:hypothetical protein
MMRKRYRLVWEGPFGLTEFLEHPELVDRFSCPGVYLWIQRMAHGDVLNYVGKAGGRPTLYARQVQHYVHLIGGLYTIPGEFRHSGEDWIPDWRKSDVSAILLNPERFHELVGEAFGCARSYSIHLARLDGSEEAKAVERQLLFDLQPTGTSRGTGSPPDAPVEIVHADATWATEQIRETLDDQRVRFA